MTTKEYQGVTGTTLEVNESMGDVGVKVIFDLPVKADEDDKRILGAIVRMMAEQAAQWMIVRHHGRLKEGAGAALEALAQEHFRKSQNTK